jgi:hypothetical protein
VHVFFRFDFEDGIFSGAFFCSYIIQTWTVALVNTKKPHQRFLPQSVFLKRDMQ